jgi:hypothetical protein
MARRKWVQQTSINALIRLRSTRPMVISDKVGTKSTALNDFLWHS